MADPTTVNIALIVPNTGADVDTWGAVAINPDMVAMDGFIGGVQTIGVTNAPVTLTAPAGAITPGPGPTQSQNRVLRFTGAMTANVQVTLPLPGAYLIDNRTTGNFVLSFQGVTATEVIAVDQGNIVEIYNDGANVRFVNLGKVGALELWGGISAIPAWVAACTVRPYLLCDGTVYNISAFPSLGGKFGATFGGNGATTFGVQDLQGRVPLAYDGTGVRITVAGCGINGQMIGASQDKQNNTIVTLNLPAYTPAGGVAIGGSQQFTVLDFLPGSSTGGSNVAVNQKVITVQGSSFTGTFTGTPQGGTSTPLNNVQPSQVAGIWVVKT